MKTVSEVLEMSGMKPVLLDTIIEETGLSEEEVIERLKRLASRGDAMETKKGYWMELR